MSYHVKICFKDAGHMMRWYKISEVMEWIRRHKGLAGKPRKAMPVEPWLIDLAWHDMLSPRQKENLGITKVTVTKGLQ